jgi:hypothetical protein
VIALVIDRYLQTVKHEQKDRAIQQTEQAIQDTFESLGKRLLARYGVQAESVTVKAEIDSRGMTRYTRMFRGIKVSRDCPIPYLPGSLMISKLGKFQSHFKLLSYTISNRQKAVSLKPGRRTDNLSEFRIEIEGLLHHSDGELTYEIECRADKMFAMTREEFDEVCKDSEFKHEYLSQELDMVAKELVIEVIFPDGFQTSTHPGVFFGQTEAMHNLELQNVQVEKTSRGARCSVKDPMIGLSYLIYWTPPSSGS